MYLTEDFNYSLPKELIAQDPVIPRDHSRLFVYDTANDVIHHKRFYDIRTLLNKDDVLVVNRSRVIPARILFDINGSKKEIFLLSLLEKNVYQVLVRPGKFFTVGKRIRISNKLECEVIKINSDGSRIVKFYSDRDINQLLDNVGSIPLPPYITDSSSTFSQYQTVYSKEKGSVAAPTAGLHFENSLIRDLKGKGVNFVDVLLHVGQGTFNPVKSSTIQDHKMHSEVFLVDDPARDSLNQAIDQKKRLIAVGTTSVRVLESNFSPCGFSSKSGSTDIFIYPGNYHWKCVDALITNFHLPKSTLLMLVSSFLESKGFRDPVKKLMELYKIAINEKYRFYSFGDAMFIF